MHLLAPELGLCLLMIATNAVFLPLGKEKLLLNGVDGGSYPPGYGGIEESTPLPRMNPYIDMN